MTAKFSEDCDDHLVFVRRVPHPVAPSVRPGCSALLSAGAGQATAGGHGVAARALAAGAGAGPHRHLLQQHVPEHQALPVPRADQGEARAVRGRDGGRGGAAGRAAELRQPVGARRERQQQRRRRRRRLLSARAPAPLPPLPALLRAVPLRHAAAVSVRAVPTVVLTLKYSVSAESEGAELVLNFDVSF